MQKLISFIIPSRRLNNVQGFFDNLEQTAADPTCFEVLLKFDDDQEGVLEFIENEVKKRPFTIKYIITPRFEGTFSLWIGIEHLFYKTDPDSYFIQILSDEPRFQTHHWDLVLRKYIGFFPDDVFRLRLSVMKYANYSSHYECTFRPDSFPIYTRRWLELTEGTGDCWGSDAYHQCVAYHLSLGPGSYFNFYREGGLWREIVVSDIELSGLEFGVGVKIEEQLERHIRNLKEWDRLTSHLMQEHFSYLARRIYCYIWAHEHGVKDFEFIDHYNRKVLAIKTPDGRKLIEVSYRVQRFLVYTQNLVRRMLTFPRHTINLILLKFRVWKLRNKDKPLFKTLDKVVVSLGIKKLYNFLFHSKNKKTDGTKRISLKRRIKLFVKRVLSYMLLPLYFLFKFLDKMLELSPPGLTALTRKKPKIPRGIKPPNAMQVEWLKEEMKLRDIKKNELTTKRFSVAE